MIDLSEVILNVKDQIVVMPLWGIILKYKLYALYLIRNNVFGDIRALKKQ
jgi:hypothetical protein